MSADTTHDWLGSCGGTTAHGFVVSFPSSIVALLNDRQPHEVTAYTFDIPYGHRVRLPNSPRILLKCDAGNYRLNNYASYRDSQCIACPAGTWSGASWSNNQGVVDGLRGMPSWPHISCWSCIMRRVRCGYFCQLQRNCMHTVPTRVALQRWYKLSVQCWYLLSCQRSNILQPM